MSEAVTIVVQINARWRVIELSDCAAWRRKAWMVQDLADDGAWHNKSAVRSAEMLREMVKAWAGPIDADAVAVLAALPARIDHRRPPETGAQDGVIHRNRALKTPAVEKTIGHDGNAAPPQATMAAKFLSWRAQKEEKGDAIRDRP